MALPGPKVPAVIATGILCLAVGAGLGILGMGRFGYHWKSEREAEAEEAQGGAPQGGPPGAGGMFGKDGGKGGKDGGKGGKGGKGGGGKGFGKAPSPKAELISLIDKLDVLTQKPLVVDLKGKEREKVREQLDALAKTEKLSNEDAQKHLDALLAALKDQRQTLEAAGYRWPGEAKAGSNFNPEMAPNPLTVEQPGVHLKALRERLEKTTS
jgi:hypothetical protein